MKPSQKHFPVDPFEPDPGIIARAAAVIREGGVVIFPTHGLYGIGADAFNPRAVDRIFTLKGRDSGKPLLVLVHRRDQTNGLTAEVDALTGHLMAQFWPGQITFVLPGAPGLPRGLLSTHGKIGIRLAGHPVAAALAAAVAGPITGTSANLSGQNGCAEITQLDPAIADAADLILDAGRLAGGPGSTVVDAGVMPPLILRQGVITADRILEACKGFQVEKK